MLVFFRVILLEQGNCYERQEVLVVGCFLDQSLEFARSRFVRMWETDTSNVGGSIFADLEESCNTLLDCGVLLRRAY